MESIRPPTRDIKISNIFKNTSLSAATKPPVNKRTTTQLAIVKWLNKRRAVGTHHTGTTTGFLSSLWSPVLPQQSWHLAAASSTIPWVEL
jgi:hypothetical protein